MQHTLIFPHAARIRSLSFLLIVAFSISAFAQEQIGRPLIDNYSYQDYNAAPINWWVIEDDNGFMYFANQAGVLQFDGVTWNLIRGAGGARCLVKDEEGTIFVGGGGEFGYLQPTATGSLEYISLMDKVPEEHRNLDVVWEVDYYQGRVFFRTEFKLYVWDGEKIEVLVSENGNHVGAVVHDTYYLRFWGRGLCYLTEDDTFELVPGGEQFADERIYIILPYDEERILIGTRTQGYFIYDGKEFVPFDTEAEQYTNGSIYLPGAALPDGRFVVNSFSDGAFLIDHDGDLIQKYTVENGLQDGAVDYTYLDSRGVLWLALFNGISSINLNNNFTFIDKTMGLQTNVVFEVYRFRDKLYLGTNNGIAYLDEEQNRTLPIAGTFGQARELFEFRGRLYACTGDMGLIEIEGDSFEYVRESRNYDFRANQIKQSEVDPNRIFVDHQQGLMSLYFNEDTGQFEEESDSDNFLLAAVGEIIEFDDGSLLMATSNDGEVVKVLPYMEDGRMDLEKSEIVLYGEEKGLPDAGINMSQPYDEEIVVFAGGDVEKTYTFNKEADRFEEKTFFFDSLIDWDSPGSAPYLTDDGKLFWNGGINFFVAEKVDGQWEVTNTETFRELNNYRIFTIYAEEAQPDGTRVVWFTGPEGVARYEGKLEKPASPDFHVKIRELSASGDSVLYAGNIAYPEGLKMPYDLNSVTLSYAAPLYIGQEDMQYSTQLEGIDDSWSEWTKQTTREYINLPPGNFSFKVRAKNIYGDITEEEAVSFSIVPPWYRTWWAYALYVLAFIAFVYFVVKARTRILIAQREALEDKVEERTREVQQRLNELATVNSVSQALTEKLELDALIKLVGDKMKEVFKSDITYLAILDEDSGIINFPYQDGDNMEPLKLGEGLTSRIINTGDPLLINHDRDIVAEYDKYGLKQTGKQAVSYLGVPIPVEEKIIGVLSVQSMSQEGRFNGEDKNLLSTIAINVGVALHNAELYEQAKEAKARAEDANEAKSAFLSTVSHELRTPLTSVLGFAKIIRKRLLDKVFPAVQTDDKKLKRTMQQVSENLDVVVSEGERLTTLINDVLDLAKIESGKMEWHMKPILVQDVIDRAISATSSLFEEKKLALKKNIPKDLPMIHGDADKLIQVVINLLSNAVKFTDEGTVVVEAYQDNKQVVVEVQDSGIGVADEDKHKIFERFRQAGDTLTDKPKGTGLGLPICREIIEHHGGIIWMKSELNVGSTFFFSLPVSGEKSKQPAELDRILNSLKKQIKHTPRAKSKNAPTILVVDDDTPIRSLLRQELTDLGYHVKEAANGKAALDLVRVSKPDLIILDVMMPEINGFDVAAVLKNDPSTMDIPIIILSIVQDKERGYRIGVDRYLTKPIDTEKLFHEVDELLEQGVSKKRVLVVDEDASTVKSLSDVLTARGYKVLEADSRNLKEQAAEMKPDIIMLKSLEGEDETAVKELKFQKGMENVMFFIYH